MKVLALVVSSLVIGLAVAPGATVVDSPIPAPFTKHVYTVPGVLAYFSMTTLFVCTNVDKKDVTVGVEIFASFDINAPQNDATESAITLESGQTTTFSTNGNVAAHPTVRDLAAGNLIRSSSARILATSTKIICTAFVIDAANSPPESAYSLNVIAKKKQKGD